MKDKQVNTFVKINILGKNWKKVIFACVLDNLVFSVEKRMDGYLNRLLTFKNMIRKEGEGEEEEEKIN